MKIPISWLSNSYEEDWAGTEVRIGFSLKQPMQTRSILLIEDDQIETVKFKRALMTYDHKHEVTLAENGEEALAFLQSDEELPDVILLDLNMPKMNGIEFLKTLKSQEKLQYIPVVILTTSNNHSDVKESYAAGAAGYLVKPLKYEEYKQQIHMLVTYWAGNEIYK